MRSVLAILFLAFLLPASPHSAQAGLVERLIDDVSGSTRDCSIEPCKYNGLVAKHRYVKRRHLRYRTERRPAHYGWRHEKVMVTPPRVVTLRKPGSYVWKDGKRLLVAHGGPVKVVRKATYAWVKRRVLLSPARTRVYRKHPHKAWYRERIVVDEGCGYHHGHC